MELERYFRRFIKGFSNITLCINSFHKKGVKFEWTHEYEEGFIHLKELLTSAHVLKIANPNEDFVVCIDACK
jgi:hypothetical protein